MLCAGCVRKKNVMNTMLKVRAGLVLVNVVPLVLLDVSLEIVKPNHLLNLTLFRVDCCTQPRTFWMPVVLPWLFIVLGMPLPLAKKIRPT